MFRPSKSSKSSKEVVAAADVVVAWEVEVEKDGDCDLHKTLQQLTANFIEVQYWYSRDMIN